MTINKLMIGGLTICRAMIRVSGFLLLSMLAVSPTSADERCLSAAQSELERLYCEVIAEGGGGSLPAQADFNRNNSQVQALLLKRPAARLGLAVPEPPKASVRETETATAEPAQASEQAERRNPPKPPQDSEPAVAQQGLANCKLDGAKIRCPQTDYTLAGNQNRAALADGVLGADNQLRLEPFTGDRSDKEAVRRYLSRAYDQYIPKMLTIGLGANTMSFTAFHNAFHTLESGGVAFSERMGQTYELLKEDRKTLGVETRYHDELPESLALCGAINRDVVVCDNVGVNWVYVRAEG